ncbi:MAG: SDR family oxidoreductase, partial [Halieaceae bacterium]|nr:SDR family oxidoreductase [Halieaceae bacterium]
DKVVVITGAGSGIGRELALQFGDAGARLALSDIDQNGLDQTIAMLAPRTGSTVKGYLLDVSSREAVFAHAGDVKQDFGAAHYVVNNAGATIFGTVDHTSIEEYEWQLGVNMWGVLYGTKAFLPMMLAQKEGCIVNISSVFGLLGFPTQSAYNMSKFAVRGLTEALWSELEGTGVQAVCVHPGGIATSIEKSGRTCAAATDVDRQISAQSAKLLITPPADCAADIIRGLLKGKKRIITGNKSTTMFWMARLFPNSYPRLLRLLG